MIIGVFAGLLQMCIRDSLQTAACAVTYWFRISNPNIILFVILSAVLVQFGYKAGILCGGIIYLYTMFCFSVEHSFWIFDTDGRGKVMVVAIGIVANILIVGSLKEQMERINKERLHQLETVSYTHLDVYKRQGKARLR